MKNLQLADQPAPWVSSNYSFVNTKDLVKAAQFKGFGLQDVYVAPARKITYRGEVHLCTPEYQRHIVTLQTSKPSLMEGDKPLFGQIVINNSYNGLSSLSLHGGLFRVICSNGLVSSEDAVASYRKAHKGDTDFKAKVLIEMALTKIDYYMSKVKESMEIQLTEEQKIQIARRILQKRNMYLISVGALSTQRAESLLVDYEDLLKPKRSQDSGNSLWSTINIIQEKIIQGGITYRFKEESKKSKTSTPLTGVKSFALNRIISQELEQFFINDTADILSEN